MCPPFRVTSLAIVPDGGPGQRPIFRPLRPGAASRGGVHHRAAERDQVIHAAVDLHVTGGGHGCSLGQAAVDASLVIRSLVAGVIVVVLVAVVVRVVLGGGSALTGRIGRHSTARLAVVAAARLVLAQLDEGVRRSHPHLGSEGGVVGDPVGPQGPWTWSRLRFLSGLWHKANGTTNAVAAPVRPRLTSPAGMPGRTRPVPKAHMPRPIPAR